MVIHNCEQLLRLCKNHKKAKNIIDKSKEIFDKKKKDKQEVVEKHAVKENIAKSKKTTIERH